MADFNQTMAYGELLCVERCLWLYVSSTENANYDYRVDQFFPCSHGRSEPTTVCVVPRVGAISNYESVYHAMLDDGIQFINDPGQQRRASELTSWYPLLEGLTPESVWDEKPPAASSIGERLGWPIFVKGSRQTSRHQRSLCIIEGPEQFERMKERFQSDPILRWQTMICRKYVSLRRVEDQSGDRLPASFEFRTFWWKQHLVGIGPYWWQGKPYSLSPSEREAAVAIARQAAEILKVPFLVVDVAQQVDGAWIVIECNDGQESGYAGVSPLALWQRIIEIERERSQVI